MNVFDNPTMSPLDENIVATLINTLTLHNEYVRTFMTAKEVVVATKVDSYAISLLNNIPDRRYDPPLSGTLCCIVYGDDYVTNKYDIIFTQNLVILNGLVNFIRATWHCNTHFFFLMVKMFGLHV